MSAFDELKFVIGDRADYEFAKDIVLKAIKKGAKVHFSPVFSQIESALLADWILEDGLDVRLQLQIHKIIWNPDQRGV